MNRIKISAMAIAFFLTAGVTYAIGSPDKAKALDCSATGNLPATIDSSTGCPTPRTVFCCITTDGNFTTINKKP